MDATQKIIDLQQQLAGLLNYHSAELNDSTLAYSKRIFSRDALCRYWESMIPVSNGLEAIAIGLGELRAEIERED